MKIGIISYSNHSEKRKKARLNQYNWLRSIFPKKEIVIVAQNYEQSDYIDDKNVRYINFEKPIGPSKARNVILKEFYNSQEDFLLLLDDDCILYDYYNAVDLLLEIENNPKKFKGIDNITGNNPKYLPFKKENYSDKNVLKYWKLIKRPYNTGAPFAVYRNIKKYKKQEVYFNENNMLSNKINEDVDFHIEWCKNNNSYICCQWQMKEMSGEESTIFTKDRIKEEKICIYNMIKKRNLDIIKNGKILWKNIPNATIKNTGYIKREKQLTEYGQNEIPK